MPLWYLLTDDAEAVVVSSVGLVGEALRFFPREVDLEVPGTFFRVDVPPRAMSYDMSYSRLAS